MRVIAAWHRQRIGGSAVKSARDRGGQRDFNIKAWKSDISSDAAGGHALATAIMNNGAYRRHICAARRRALAAALYATSRVVTQRSAVLPLHGIYARACRARQRCRIRALSSYATNGRRVVANWNDI